MTTQVTEDRSVVVTESKALFHRAERHLSEGLELTPPLRESRERTLSALATIRAYKLELCLSNEADRPIFFSYQAGEGQGDGEGDAESTLFLGSGFAAEERARLEAVFRTILRLSHSSG